MERRKMFCPFMKEWCIDGWTKSMGEEADGSRGKCRCWINLKGNDPQTDEIIDQGDCCLPWTNIMQIEQSKLMKSQVINTELLRNDITKNLQPPN